MIIYNSAQILSDQCIFNKLAENNKLILGTWQGIYLFEHRIEQQIRKVFLHIVGET
jgi:thiamine phosphate synthase YjbQ (UPF0047 family)